MSTYSEIIQRADENKPNDFSVQTKLNWLTGLDGRIAADVFLMSIAEIRTLPHRYPDALDCEPLVTFPHEEIYDLWLEAKIDAANGETNKYRNSMLLYNESYSNFLMWFSNTYEPAQNGDGWRRKTPTHYVTAYGLAVQQGFRGSLDEWLASLVGPTGETGKSAYEYAKEHGYAGTEAEFADQLTTGKTAYQYAVEGGYQGTPEDFVRKMAAEYAEASHTHNMSQLLAQGYVQLSDYQYGEEFPEDAPDGTIFFVPARKVSG